MKDSREKTGINYKDSGVNIEKGDAFVEAIKPLASKTRRLGEIGGIGGFGGLFDIGALGYDEPILVASTDGVGTKLLLALENDLHEQIGIDLVAMCVNDLVVQGAEPLFFLDYLAMGNLEMGVGKAVMKGIVNGCQIAGASLLGGETAEMPGLYAKGHYDLAGFAVGIVEKKKIIDGSAVQAGDVILGLSSSGLHSNGFSLFRKIRDLNNNEQDKPTDKEALCPTKIYVKPILSALKNHEIHAISHITGGGLTNNIPRVLPEGLCANIRLDSWPAPKIFKWLSKTGPVEESEMLRTFNCGIGMIVVIPVELTEEMSKTLTDAGEEVFKIGNITRGKDQISYSGKLFT